MEKRSIIILCIALTGGLTASAGSLDDGLLTGTSLIPLPELTDSFSDARFQPGDDIAAAARFEMHNGFTGLSSTAPTPAWSAGLAGKLSSLEPAPFESDTAAPGSNQSGSLGSLYGAGGVGSPSGSQHEADAALVKTTVIPLPSAGLLALAGLGMISAGRRRAQIA